MVYTLNTDGATGTVSYANTSSKTIKGGATKDKAVILKNGLIPANVGYGWFKVKIANHWFAFDSLESTPTEFDNTKLPLSTVHINKKNKTFIFDDFALNPAAVEGRRHAIGLTSDADLHTQKRTVLINNFKAMIAPENVPINVIDPYERQTILTSVSGGRGGVSVNHRKYEFNHMIYAVINKKKPVVPPTPPAPKDPKTGTWVNNEDNAGVWQRKFSPNSYANQFNPPPHKTVAGISPLVFEDFVLGRDSYGYPITNLSLFNGTNRKGFIYQDLDSASTETGSAKSINQLWGFQFMYNPGTISYGNSVNTNVDFTNKQDVGALLSGSQTVTFSLFLNRLIDLHMLKEVNKNLSTVNGWRDISLEDAGTAGIANYYRSLTPSQLKQIYYRGTEYDLEYLYRVINGEPLNGPVTNFATADFGYLVGSPVWVRFHDNMVYKGIISQIQVEHVMFNIDMVPAITQVNISFFRIPTPTYGTDEEQMATVQKRYSQRSLPYLYKLPGSTLTPPKKP